MQTAQILFWLNAVVWVGLTGAYVLHNSASQPLNRWIIGGMMAGNAGAMALVGFGLGVRPRLFFILAALVLSINILLSVTDQFGLADVLTMLYDAGVLGFLLVRRNDIYAHK